jgi:hypothetical protein
MVRMLLVMVALATMSVSAHAKVRAQQASGFSLAFEAEVPKTPAEAYDAFVAVGSWWDVAHSYSGKAENIRLNPVPGGAWTEALANGGFVTHLVVSQASPGERLVLNGGLGPLAFMGISGAMTVTFAKSPAGTKVVLVYNVGGFDKDGFVALSKAVDGVLEGQFAHYVSYASTGKP